MVIFLCTFVHTWFSNPSNPNDTIFAFADVPHLIKLIRNHFLDTGLLVNNQLLTSRTISDLLKYTSTSMLQLNLN